MKRTLGLLLAVLLAGCGHGSSGTSDARPQSEFDGEWELTAGRGPDGEVTTLKDNGISFKLDRGEVSGTAACNSYDGTVTISGASYKLKTGYMITEAGCLPEILESEDRYMNALYKVDTIERDGDTLTLSGPSTELTYEFVPPPEPAPLVGTKWHLNGLVYGRGPDGLVSNPTGDAYLILEDDGTLRGSTGCRDFTARWTGTDDAYEVSDLSFEGRCPKEHHQDDQIVIVLSNGFTAKVEERQLLLYAAEGEEGLIYNAPEE